MNLPAREKIRIPVLITALLTVAIFAVATVLLYEPGFPVLLIFPFLVLVTWIALTSIETFLLITVFLTPVSVQLRFIAEDPPADLFIPTEIFLAMILLIMVFKIFVSREVDRRILTHPVTMVSLLLLAWMLVTSVTGTMPLVSLKHFIMRIWFYAGFYLLSSQLFLNRQNIRKYFTAYIAGMVPVLIWYIIKMTRSGLFNRQAAYQSTLPFFNDHTSLGAAIAFCIPVILFFLFTEKRSPLKKTILLAFLFFFSFSLMLSYSRAAWLSMAVSVILTTALALRIRFRTMMIFSVAAAILLVISWRDIMLFMQENRHNRGNITEHVRSIANITTDVSNLERINRWKSALRMWKEKPLFGWGPATYQFQYAPFQISSEKTKISTIYGERGNAHSEYLGAMAETGLPGALIYIALLAVTLSTAGKLMRKSSVPEIRLLMLFMIAGITTYVVHGAMNNFLDTDKISALFWGMTAAITAAEIKSRTEESSA